MQAEHAARNEAKIAVAFLWHDDVEGISPLNRPLGPLSHSCTGAGRLPHTLHAYMVGLRWHMCLQNYCVCRIVAPSHSICLHLPIQHNPHTCSERATRDAGKGSCHELGGGVEHSSQYDVGEARLCMPFRQRSSTPQLCTTNEAPKMLMLHLQQCSYVLSVLHLSCTAGVLDLCPKGMHSVSRYSSRVLR